MPPDLVPLWDAIETGKSEIVRRARALPADVFTAPRKPGDWSPAQMLHHLAIAEGEVTGQITDLQAGKSVDKKAPAFAVSLLTQVLRWGVPLPAPPNMLPSLTPPGLDETERLWSEHRAFLKARLDNLQAGDVSTPIALHPIAGPMNAPQVLRLADAHQVYHLRQLPK